MRHEKVIRTALGVSVPFNLIAAFLFAFPTSAVAQAAGVPVAAPPLYRALLALFLMLFAGAYAWLCQAKDIATPLVGFAAIGKGLAFLVFVSLWLLGLGPGKGAIASIGDAVLAAIFFWWLAASRPTAREYRKTGASGNSARQS